MQFRLLGPFEAAVGGRQVVLRRRQERCLLGLLLLQAGQAVPVDRLAELLWDGAPPAQSTRIIQSQIARLRAAIGRPVIVTAGPGYAIDVDPATIDAHQFEAAVRRAGAEPDLARRAAALHEALSLWRGPLLADCASDMLRARVGQGLDELRAKATEDWFDAELRLGHHRERVGDLAVRVAERPDSEPLVGLLMLALHRCGRSAEAAAQYAVFRRRLADQYGLDPGRALTDLHAAILRADPALDWRPPETTASPVRPAMLPLDVYGFAGRKADLVRLDQLLATAMDQPTATVIGTVSGMAGIGKTTLVVHWAQRVRADFPDGQLYANLRGFDPEGAPLHPGEALRGFLEALGVPQPQIPPGLAEQTGLYRSLLAGRRMLVVLDNARDADQVRPLLPGAPGCLVLVVSRYQLTSLAAAEGARPVQLDLLTVGESRDLLVRRLGTERVAAEPAAVEAIIEACGRLPLALSVVAARAGYTDSPLAAIAEELRRGQLDVLHGGDAATDARAVFSWSYRAVGEDARLLFRWLALHPGPSISAAAAASLAGVSGPVVRGTLDELARHHLINETVPGRYDFHDLLRAYALELVRTSDHESVRQRVVRRIVDHYLHTAYAANRLLDPSREPITLTPAAAGVTVEPLDDQAGSLAWFRAEHPVLVALIDSPSTDDTQTWQLTWGLETFLDRHGLWHILAATQAAAGEAALRLGDRPVYAMSERYLGRAHARLSQYPEATRHLNRALAEYEALGEPVAQGHTHLELTRLRELAGDFAGALRHSQRAYDLYLSAGNQVGQARAANNIGWHLAQLGRYHQALTWCQRALDMHLASGTRHSQAVTWDSLGYVHHRLGQFERAVACFHNAIELFREYGDRFYEADVLIHLGDAHEAAGDTASAVAAWERSLRILEDLKHSLAESVRQRLATR